MSASDKKLVVVLGATGAQGNPVARYLLKHSSHFFKVRAITRDSTKPSAQELRSLGAEVVEADFDNESSLTAAFNGAHSIFAITNFWDKALYDLEIKQGKLVNKLASQLPHLEHYFFSSLPDARELVGGKFQNILPYNAKAAILEDLYTYPRLTAITTEVFVAFYFQNWIKYQAVFGPDQNGNYALSMPFPPTARVPTSWADDVGVLIDTLLKSGTKYYGRSVLVSADIITQQEMVSTWEKHTGIKLTFQQASTKDHQKRMESNGLPPHIAIAVTELAEALIYEEEALSATHILQARDIIPADYRFTTWEEYVKEEDWSTLQ